MKVELWLARHPGTAVTVQPEDSLERVLDYLLDAPSCLRDLYVVDREGRLSGHISHKRVAEYMLAEHCPVHTRRQIMERVTGGGSAGDFMDVHFPTASPAEELEDVIHRQLEKGLEDMPVVAPDGTLLGAVNLTLVLRELCREDRFSIDQVID